MVGYEETWIVAFLADEYDFAADVVRLRYANIAPMGRTPREVVSNIFWGSVAELAVSRFLGPETHADCQRRLLDTTLPYDGGTDFVHKGIAHDVKHQRTHLRAGFERCMKSTKMNFHPMCTIRPDVVYVHTVADPDQPGRALYIVGGIRGSDIVGPGPLWKSLHAPGLIKEGKVP